MTDMVTIDTRGLRCPLPVLRVLKLMREHQNTHDFQVFATDPAAESELRALCLAKGWALSREASGTDGITILRIVRRAPTVDEADQG